MTHLDDTDLATLLRQDVSATEPTHGLDTLVPVRLGRRRLRTRRLVSGAAAAVVVAVGTAVAVPLVSGDGSGPSRGVDPVSQSALDHYDAQQMPQLMDDHVRGVLERSVPDLGPVTFRAGDGNGSQLPPELYDKASGMSVTYGDDAHYFSVDISHSGSEAEGDPSKYCPGGLREGYYLECSADVRDDGTIVFTRLEALQQSGTVMSGRETVPGWGVVSEAGLSEVDPSELYFERSVKVIKSRTLITTVSERVHVPTIEAARAALLVPPADVVEIGTDPVLVMPEPPLDDSGCGPFVLDPRAGHVAC
jgi:hypothetical protein